MASWEAEPSVSTLFSVHTLSQADSCKLRISLVCAAGNTALRSSSASPPCTHQCNSYRLNHDRIHYWAGPSRNHFADAWNKMRATAPSAGRTAFADANALTSRYNSFVSLCRLCSTPCFCISARHPASDIPSGCLSTARLCRIGVITIPHACQLNRGQSRWEGVNLLCCTRRRASLLRSALH